MAAKLTKIPVHEAGMPLTATQSQCVLSRSSLGNLHGPMWNQHQPTAGGTAGLCLPGKVGEGLAHTHVESGLNLH